MTELRHDDELTVSRYDLNMLLQAICLEKLIAARKWLTSTSKAGAHRRVAVVDSNTAKHYYAATATLDGEDPWDYIQRKDDNGDYILWDLDAVLSNYELFVEVCEEDYILTNGVFAQKLLMLRPKHA